MKVACLGGGPAGLYFAISLKLKNPDHDITVFERNKPDDTFGWGVVLSDETLTNLKANDPVSAEAIHSHFAYWDDISVIHKGVNTVSTGHGFCGIGRMRLLLLLQERARELGVKLQFETNTGETIIAGEDHRIVFETDAITAEPHPIVHVRSGLNALLNRPVFYRLVDLAQTRNGRPGDSLGVWSAGEFFELSP